MEAALKLRLGFAAVVIPAGLLAVIATSDLRLIESNTQVIVDQALPVLVAVEDLSAISLKLVQDAGSYRGVQDPDLALSVIQSMQNSAIALEAASARVRAIPRNLPKVDTLPTDEVSNLVDSLTQASLARFNFLSKIQGITDRLLQDLEHLNRAVEIEAKRVALKLSQDQSGKTFATEYRLLMMILTETRALRDLIERLNENGLRQDASQDAGLIEIAQRKLILSLSRLPKSDGRDQIARHLADISTLIETEDPVGLQSSGISASNTEERILTLLQNSVRKLNGDTKGLSELVRGDIVAMGEDVTTTTAKDVSTFIALACVSGLVSLLILYFVVEKQFTQRLRIVSRNVQYIEDGELTPQPKLKGNDEISRFGRSLDQLRALVLRQTQLETKLRETALEAEKASLAKSDFLAQMSHEVRTPLNAIMGIFELIQSSDIPERQKVRAERGHKSAFQLYELLSKILDASRLDSDDLRISVEKTTFAELGEYLDTTLSGAITQSGKDLESFVELDPDLPEGFETDIHRLKQVLGNLVDNAARFTDEGHIKVSVRMSPADSDFLEFAVSDTGIGIAPENHKLIFEKFRQVDSGVTRSKGGSGLGLAISRDIAKLCGGDLYCESEDGEGAVFVLRLPIRQSQENEVAA